MSPCETPVVLRAADVVPPELLQSSRYRIEEQVATNGLLAKVVFHSELGDFVAEGPRMAPVRAAEIQALDVLSKTESSEISRRPLQASLSPRAGQELTAWRWTIGEGVSIVPPAAPGTPRS